MEVCGQIGFKDMTGLERAEPEERDAWFADLVVRQSRLVFRVAFALLRNAHDAEDVVQETFLKLYRNGGWQGMRDEKAFLARTAWRIAIDRIPKGVAGKSEELSEGLPSKDAGPEDIALAASQDAWIHRMVDSLPEDLRRPLVLSALSELNSRQIAELMGIPEGTVRTRMQRARQILKQKMSGGKEGRNARR